LKPMFNLSGFRLRPTVQDHMCNCALIGLPRLFVASPSMVHFWKVESEITEELDALETDYCRWVESTRFVEDIGRYR